MVKPCVVKSRALKHFVFPPQIMLEKLAGITSLAASKPMIAVLLKLFGYCVKLRSNRQLLLSPGMGTIPVLLNTLKLCLAAGETAVATGHRSLVSFSFSFLSYAYWLFLYICIISIFFSLKQTPSFYSSSFLLIVPVGIPLPLFPLLF